MATGFVQILKQNLAVPTHAYCIYGLGESGKGELLEYLEEEWGIDVKSNPDFINLQFQLLKIEDIREVSEIQQKGRLSENTRRVIILEFDSITTAAQNAFLKVLEEPTEGTVFFLLVPKNINLLSTINSRVVTINANSLETSFKKEAKIFIESSYGEREKIFTKIFLADPKKNKPADRGGASLFFSDLELVLFENKDNISDFEEIYKKYLDVIQYAGDKSSNIKYIFELVSLMLPMVK